LQASTKEKYSELDESVGTLLEIMSDLEKGNEESPMASAIMQQVTVKIKEVLDQVTKEQKAAAAQSAKEMEQAKLEADAALKAESERLRKETAERKAAEKERAQQSQLATMKAKAAAEKTRAKCLVEGWVALESVTVVGEKKRDAKRKQSWIELTPGLLSLHKQFLGHASSCLPVLAADVRVVERQEKKPGSGVFSNEKIPVCEKRWSPLSTFCTENDHFTRTGSGQTEGKHSKSRPFSSSQVWLVTIDLAADSIARARGVHYQTLVLCFAGEEQRATFTVRRKQHRTCWFFL
jgi:hypothetical protein